MCVSSISSSSVFFSVSVLCLRKKKFFEEWRKKRMSSSKKSDGIPTPKVDSDIHTLCKLGDVSGLKNAMKKSGSDEINKPDSMQYVSLSPPPFTYSYTFKHTQTNTTLSYVKNWQRKWGVFYHRERRRRQLQESRRTVALARRGK